MPSNRPGCLPSFLHRLGPTSQPTSTHQLPPNMPPEPAPETLPYLVRSDFLSPAEASFYHVLKTVVGDQLMICPKVSLADIFFVSHPEKHQAYWNKINRKHVDFLLCDPSTLQPRLALELDDASHAREDRIERDRFINEIFITASLPLLHVPARTVYSTQELAALLRNALRTVTRVSQPQQGNAANSEQASSTPPICPKCGIPMVIRTAHRGAGSGQTFYGCSNYPHCRETLPISKSGPAQIPEI